VAEKGGALIRLERIVLLLEALEAILVGDVTSCFSSLAPLMRVFLVRVALNGIVG
jgi:hypothetical protein